MDVEIVPCSRDQIEKLIEGCEAFHVVYGLEVVDGYLPFEGALQYTLNLMQSEQIWHPWLSYLFICRADRALVGLGGFKSVPDANQTVEIGYSVAPRYQNRGVATAAARQMIEIAFASGLVNCVCAHTLAEIGPSTRVLGKSGMTQVAEVIDPDDGKLWRWEIVKMGNLGDRP